MLAPVAVVVCKPMCIEAAALIDLRAQVSLDLCYAVFLENWDISKNKGIVPLKICLRHTHTHNHFTALQDFVRDYLGELAPER